MYGNERIHKIITAYTNTIITTGSAPVPFVLFQWPDWLWKKSAAIEMWQQIVWEYAHQDMLILHDYSKEIGKDHTVKVSHDEEITLKDWSIYADIGIREVNQWLVTSPAWKRKVLIIEHAERITDQATNALLKMVEEPLPGRVIIATTSRPNSILPTIVSRALLFSFYPTDDNIVLQVINKNPVLSQYNQDWLMALAWWRPWVLEDIAWDQGIMDILEQWFIALTQWHHTLIHMYNALVAIAKIHYEKVFLQACISRFASKWQWYYVSITQHAYWLTDYTINSEHIFFDFVTAYHAAKNK